MIPAVPPLEEIAGTVERLEKGFQTMDHPRARELMSAYSKVARRFEADLSEARDIAIAKGGALMLMKSLLDKD